MCSVPTRKGATLQLILTDLHSFMHPPSSHPPLQVDEWKKGVDSDHQALILAPKASSHFVKKREKRKVLTRPMPESKVNDFCAELTQHNWSNILNSENPHQKVELFQKYLIELKDKHFPEKEVSISSLDKQWMTPELKLLLRQVQRERLKNGKNGKFKQLWSKFRRLKRAKVKQFYRTFVEELKTTNPSKWYSMMKRLGGLDQMDRGKLQISSLEGLTDAECAEAVAQSFAEVSQEYEPLDRT